MNLNQIDEIVKKKRKEKVRTQSTYEGWTLFNAKAGDTFFTEKQDKDISAMASYYKRKVLTERLVVVTPCYTNPSVKPIIKVTIVQ